MAGMEYRVVWQREGRVQQVKRYATLKGATTRYALLASATPWEALGKEANDWACCTGQECSCGGETYQGMTERIARETPLKYARLDSRIIGDWKEYQPTA